MENAGDLRMKVLIADDHALIREALHAVLKELKRETVIFEASNSRQAMRIVEEHPDLSLILLDINLPDRDGFSVLGELRERDATIAIIVLSAVDDQDTVKRAFKLGALGFIPKTTEREVMLNAIQLVLSGGIYIPSEIVDTRTSERSRVDGSTDRGACAFDARKEQQGHCQHPQYGRADGEEPNHSRSQGTQGNEPHRGSDKSGKNGLGIAVELRVIKPISSTPSRCLSCRHRP